jgi:hypothetical protein
MLASPHSVYVDRHGSRFEVIDGKETLATLEMTTGARQRALARHGDTRWTFQTQGFFSPYVALRNAEGFLVGRFETDHRRGGTLHLAGARYDLRCESPNERSWQDRKGRRILTIFDERCESHQLRFLVHEEHDGTEALPLLALITSYLREVKDVAH